MKVLARQFNIYLTLAVLLGLAGGCETSSSSKSKKEKQQVAALRVHIETTPDPLGSSQQITVLRSDPVLVTIKREPILSEANIIKAKIIEAQGGFALEIKFDENGTWMLEQYSAANPGRHFVIYGQWSEKSSDGRWLAAPLISRRNGSGTLAFTPDCSREEADLLVPGLNTAGEKAQKQKFK
jgi:hypothetical protein